MCLPHCSDVVKVCFPPGCGTRNALPSPLITPGVSPAPASIPDAQSDTPFPSPDRARPADASVHRHAGAAVPHHR